MSSLIARIKIFPIDAGIKSSEILESLGNNLPQGMKVLKAREEPIAYGLLASILEIEIEDKEGTIDLLEEIIRKSPKVSQIEVIGVSRGSTTLR